MIEFFAEILSWLFGWTRTEPYPDPDRDFSLIFLLGMGLLLTVGVGAIYFLLR